MKVLHLNEHLSWSGGIETYLLSLVPELEARGHRQVIGFADGDGALVNSARRLPVLASAGWNARRLAKRQVAELLDDERPDVVHVHNIHNIGALEACLDRVPTVLHGHDYRYLCPASTFYFRATESICGQTCGPACYVSTVRGRCLSLRPPYAWNYYRRVRFVAARAASFQLAIANSRYMGNRFEQAGFAPEQVSVLPYFCPVEPLDRPRPLPERPTILFIGRARANKGFRYFVEALGMLPAFVRGIMVGDFSDDVEAAIHRLAARSNCSERMDVRSWASRETIDEVYRSATLTVVPSIWAEPLGIVGLESLAHGVPVVGSDVGGIRDWLIHGETGRVVPAKSPAAIAQAAREILESPDQGLTLGENGCRRIREHFSVSGHVARLLDHYRGAMEGSRRPKPSAVACLASEQLNH